LPNVRAHPSIARFTLDRALGEVLPGLDPGVVMDVGAKHSPYRVLVPATEYLTLDIRPDAGADIVGDLHDVPRESASLDTVIATEVLEHCYDPARAVGEVHRLLRPGGVCVLSTRFVHPYHPDPHDYFRFTNEGLAHLFAEFSQVQIRPLGNRVHAVWTVMPGRPAPVRWFRSLITPLVAAIDIPHSPNPCGYLVRAVK
jgi:SAM-dependent methyltransferase